MVYKLVTYKNLTADELNAEAENGWCVVSVLHNRSGNYVVVYKRPSA